jgi:hypothetical protein
MFDCDDMDDLAPTITPAVLLSVDTIRAPVSLTASLLGRAYQRLWLDSNYDASVVHLR